MAASLRHPTNLGNPGEFDYVAYLARRRIYVTAFVETDEDIVRLGSTASGGGVFPRWRGGVGTLFRDTLGSREAAVLSALIIGTDAALQPDLRDAFSRAGVSHILSISGLHIGLVASTGYAVFRWLLARSEWLLLTAHVPKLATALSAAPVLAYAAIAGGNVATVRAVIMVLVFLGAVLVDRQRHLLVSLAAAAVLILLSAPGSAADISFQLSFAAVLGLTLGLGRFWPSWLAWEERRLLRLRGHRTRLWRTVALSAAVTTSALAATMPLTAYHFNQLSMVAPLANTVVVPVLGSAAVGLGLLAALMWPLSARAAAAITWTAGWCVTLGVRLVEELAALPAAAVRVVTPTGLELVLVYGALLSTLLLRGRHRAATLALLAVVAVADGASWWWDRHHRTELRITFLSVGHGDSAVIEFPGSAVMVLDGGGIGDSSFDPGERVIAPFLWSRKIARLDHIVLSHPQADHFGGLGFLATQFAPREFWSSGLEADAARYRTFLQDVDRGGVRRLQLRRGDHRRIGPVAIDALWPDDVRSTAAHSAADLNDQSLVLRFTYAGTRVLFAGDIGTRPEKTLVTCSADALRSDVLKVPHHGSDTSSTAAFLDAVAPRLAVVSSGWHDRFHLPRPAVLARYAARRCQVLRTDRDGAVTLRIGADGRVDVRRCRLAVGTDIAVDSTADGG
jgi:competence protein ComEC